MSTLVVKGLITGPARVKPHKSGTVPRKLEQNGCQGNKTSFPIYVQGHLFIRFLQETKGL
jgi:hypothetical protein